MALLHLAARVVALVEQCREARPLQDDPGTANHVAHLMGVIRVAYRVVNRDVMLRINRGLDIIAYLTMPLSDHQVTAIGVGSRYLRFPRVL